ncbi:MAG: hypothetical protein JSS46_13425 [Proteobacteria bacterium]|jgi:hypothetical protein|nr:hypothetical protein [Pseudomonadota bacterium]
MVVKRCGLREQLNDSRRLVVSGILVAALLLIASFVRNRAIAHAMLLGGIVGVLTHWWMTGPAEADVPGAFPRAARVSEWIERRGYARAPGTDRWIPKRSWWLCYRSEDIVLEQIGAVIRVRGPHHLMKRLAERVADSVSAPEASEH